MTFKQLLVLMRQTLLEAVEHQNYPIEALLHKLDLPLPAPGDRFPLFDVAILLENIHSREYLKSVHTGLLFSFLSSPEGVTGVVEYDTSLYLPSSIQRWVTHYLFLLEK